VVLPGTHFFIKDRPEAVIEVIEEEIRGLEEDKEGGRA
jgi:surfactin synthase thioesterase subunit